MRDDAGSYDEIMRLTSSNRGESGASAYDFRKTEKFTGDQQKFLEKVFVSFSEAVITGLAGILQTRFHMELLKIVPRSYTQYLNTLPETTPMLIFNIDSDVQGFIDIEFGLAFALFERLMGGKGQPPRDEIRDYFTDLEKAILQKILTRLLDAYAQAWKDIKAVKPQLESFEFNPMAVHIASPSELMVVVPFQAEMASATGAIDLVLPFRYLRDIIPKTSFDEFRLSKTSPGSGPQQQMVPFMTKHLQNARLPITVSLGKTELLFQELLSLEVGDTIRLDTEISQPLRVKVNNKTKFLGYPGVKDFKLACKINKVLQDGDEEADE